MRYLPHTEDDIAAMLGVVGVDSLDDLFATIPEDCCCRLGMRLPEAMTEWELNDHMDALAARTTASPACKVFVGAGRYDHFVPASAQYLVGRGEFVTSYTPYQPEISQGTLQAVYEYQTLASRLMGVEVATASHYDGSTALAESLLMAVRVTRKKKVAVSRAIHPLYRSVIRTYLHPTGYEMVELPCLASGRTDLSGLDSAGDLAAVAVQSPNFFGCIEDLAAVEKTVHGAGALLVAAFTEAVAYGLLKSPGSLGADVVCGEGQSLGLSQSFGGPGLGMLGTRMQHVRNLPGRLVGRTRDVNGKEGFVLTLATREQHIRREKATSNICTNNSLCALAAVVYMASLGRTGFHELAKLNHDKAEYLKSRLAAAGLNPAFSAPTFNEFVVRAPADFARTHKRLLADQIVAGLPLAPYDPALADHYLFCVTETLTKADMDRLVKEVRS